MITTTREGVRLLEQVVAELMADDGRPADCNVTVNPLRGEYPNEWQGAEYYVSRPDPLPGTRAQAIGTVRVVCDDLDASSLLLQAKGPRGSEVGRASLQRLPAAAAAALARQMIAALRQQWPV